MKYMGSKSRFASIFGDNLVGWTIWYTLGALINFKAMCFIAEEVGI